MTSKIGLTAVLIGIGVFIINLIPGLRSWILLYLALAWFTSGLIHVIADREFSRGGLILTLLLQQFGALLWLVIDVEIEDRISGEKAGGILAMLGVMTGITILALSGALLVNYLGASINLFFNLSLLYIIWGFSAGWIFAGCIYFFVGRAISAPGLIAALLFSALGAIIWLIADVSKGEYQPSRRKGKFYETSSRRKTALEREYKCFSCRFLVNLNAKGMKF